MSRYQVDQVKDGAEIYYFLRCMDDMSIVVAPTKYLKHKTNSHRAPNTVHRIALSLSYYLNYLDSLNLTLSDIYNMKYDKQHVHFTDMEQIKHAVVVGFTNVMIDASQEAYEVNIAKSKDCASSQSIWYRWMLS